LAASTASSALATDTKIAEAYARLVARNAYFWAWPMVNVGVTLVAAASHRRHVAYAEVVVATVGYGVP
jgi:hypothetical protein